MKSNTKLKLGLIGTGKIARIHARNISESIPRANIVAVASKDSKRAATFAQEFGIEHHCIGYADIFEHDIDAVLICSTADSHPDLIIKAAKHGVHVFCEKPIGFDLQMVDRAIAAAKEARIKLFIGFNRRFDPHFKAAKDRIREERIGVLEVVSIVSRDPKEPSPENLIAPGALFTETMIHDLDMACFLVESKPTSIFVASSVLINKDFAKQDQVDTAVATLQFESGAIAVIRNSWRSTYGYDQRVEVHGSKGDIFVKNVTEHSIVELDDVGEHNPPPLFFFEERYQDSYLAEMKVFVNCVKGDLDLPATPESARMATVLALAARTSSTTGKSISID